MIINCIDKISTDTRVLIEGWVSRFLWFNFSLKNEELEIFHGDNKILDMKTNNNGEFAKEYDFKKPGLYSLRLRLKKYNNSPGILNILIIDPNDKKDVVVCDIDNTIVNFSYVMFFFGFDLDPIEGARSVLWEISKKYYLIYLTHRHDMFTNNTKEWILEKDFPLSPVFLWSIKDDPFRSYSYKVSKIKSIKKDTGLNIVAGIGDRESDIMAYRETGIPNIFLVDSSNSWEKIRKELL